MNFQHYLPLFQGIVEIADMKIRHGYPAHPLAAADDNVGIISKQGCRHIHFAGDTYLTADGSHIPYFVDVEFINRCGQDPVSTPAGQFMGINLIQGCCGTDTQPVITLPDIT